MLAPSEGRTRWRGRIRRLRALEATRQGHGRRRSRLAESAPLWRRDVWWRRVLRERSRWQQQARHGDTGRHAKGTGHDDNLVGSVVDPAKLSPSARSNRTRRQDGICGSPRGRPTLLHAVLVGNSTDRQRGSHGRVDRATRMMAERISCGHRLLAAPRAPVAQRGPYPSAYA